MHLKKLEMQILVYEYHFAYSVSWNVSLSNIYKDATSCTKEEKSKEYTVFMQNPLPSKSVLGCVLCLYKESTVLQSGYGCIPFGRMNYMEFVSFFIVFFFPYIINA